ncbi:MAG: pyridoxamine 5'-phosphate oxidase [Pantoea sp. Brub]|nr:pyridoxamine 5'-phosphate oxidase [Pantoea sp. Brub]
MKKKIHAISCLRREYIKGKLCRKDLPNNPIILFENWLTQACEYNLPDPTAMTIATVDKNNRPYQRVVLLKHYDTNSMVFYTNLNSRKAIHLLHNPQISLHFLWHFLERQLMILGEVEKLSTIEVLKYFQSRPRESQISTWASNQSCNISSRDILEEKFVLIKNKFKKSDIPLPDFWGGFKVKFNTMEFWQGGKYRLHDRFLYEKHNDIWDINRLAP